MYGLRDSVSTGNAYFHVSLAFLLLDQELRRRCGWDAIGLDETIEIDGHRERLRFLPQQIDSIGDFEKLIAALRATPTPKRLVVVSDCLVDGDRPAAVTTNVRTSLASASHLLCGLVALTGRSAGRVSGIDVCVAEATPLAVCQAICAAAVAIRLKAPPRRGTAATAVCVRAAHTPAELESLLKLRHHVYSMLQYLPSAIQRDPSGFEIDAYDDGALHLAALDGDAVVGGARLIAEIPPVPTPELNRSLLSARERHSRWIRAAAGRVDSAMWARSKRSSFFGLPMLQSTDFAQRWRETLERISPAGELSRVIVNPAHRGRGISRLLVREAINAARQLRLRSLVLECIPAHERMYARYGFRRFGAGVHSRDVDLDQHAVAMHLPLT